MTIEVLGVLQAVRRVVGPGRVELHVPNFRGRESLYLEKCIAEGMVSSVGPLVPEFEGQLEGFTQAKHVVATSTGTSALHLALLAVGVRPGDEVITTPLSFVATANAITYCGARPHFVDIDSDTYGLDPVALQRRLASISRTSSGVLINRDTGRTIRAVVAVHAFGNPCMISEICEVSRHHGLPIVEDAAESLGSWAMSHHTGTLGDVGTISFNGNKIVTTGGGGAVITGSAEIASFVRHLSTTAKRPHPWEYYHDAVGFNYRMPNLNAALGIAQMERLPSFLESKRKLHHRYRAELAELSSVRLLEERSEDQSNYWLNTIRLGSQLMPEREEILRRSNSEGLAVRPAWTLLSDLPPFVDCQSAPLEVARNEAPRLVSLPSSAALCEDE